MIKVNTVPPKTRPPMPNAKPRLALQRLQQQPGVSVKDYAESMEQLVGQCGYPYDVAQAVALDRLIIGLQSFEMRTQLLDFLDRSPGAGYWRLKEFAVHLDNGGSPDTWPRRDDGGPPQLRPANGHDGGPEGARAHPPPSPYHLPHPQDPQRNGLLPPPASRLDNDLRGQHDQPEPKRRCEEQYARFDENGVARNQLDLPQRRCEEQHARFNDNGVARNQLEQPQRRCEDQYTRFNDNGVARKQLDLPQRRCEEQYARFNDNGFARNQLEQPQRRCEEQYFRFVDNGVNGVARNQLEQPQRRCEEQYTRFSDNGVARVQYDEPQRRSQEYARFNGDWAGGPRRQNGDGEAHNQNLIRDQRGAYSWEWAKAVGALTEGKPEPVQPGAGVKQELVQPGPASWIGCRRCGLAADAQANRACCPRCGLPYHETRYQICVMKPFS